MTTNTTTALITAAAPNDSATSQEQPEIEVAETKVREQEDAAKWPKRAVIGALIFAFVAAGVIAIASLISDWRNDALRAAEKSLTELQIAKVKADAARKTEVDTQKVREDAANDLTFKTEELRQEAKTEQTRIETEARKDIARLTAEAEQARHEIATAQKEAAQANEKAETERLARVELEKSLAPRVIPFVRLAGKTNVDNLKPFAGTQVAIEFLPDLEPRRAAGQITQALGFAGWHVVRLTPNPELGEGFWDGVVVEASGPKSGEMATASPADQQKRMREWANANEVAAALVTFLHAHNWQARAMPSSTGDLAPNVIRVKVGYRSLPHVKTPAEEEFDRYTRQREKETEDKLNQLRDEQRRKKPSK